MCYSQFVDFIDTSPCAVLCATTVKEYNFKLGFILQKEIESDSSKKLCLKTQSEHLVSHAVYKMNRIHCNRSRLFSIWCWKCRNFLGQLMLNPSTAKQLYTTTCVNGPTRKVLVANLHHRSWSYADVMWHYTLKPCSLLCSFLCSSVP